MPEYIRPGVYIEEIALRGRAIEGASTSIAGFVGETERGPTRPTLVTSWFAYTRRYGGFIDRVPFNRPHHYLPYAVRGFFENGGTKLVVARIAGGSAETAAAAFSGAWGSARLRATGAGAWGNNVRVEVKAGPGGSDTFQIQVAYFDTLEMFDNLSADPSRPDFAQAVVNHASDLVEIIGCSGLPSAVDAAVGYLAGGVDAPTVIEDYLGEMAGNPPSGLASLTAIEDVSIMAVPDEVVIDGLAEALVLACEARRDRFAVTSEPHASRDAALIRPIRDSSWGAVYYPWLHVAASDTTQVKAVPATGHICGIYARVDVERGVHKAPANEVVRGTIAAGTGNARLSHLVTTAEQDILNPRGVNVIRDFGSPRGVRVWGARTMSVDAEWKYINVRRFFIYLEQSIDQGLQWVVFEPNTEATWLRVRQGVENFLTRVWRDGALLGSRPNDAFFVKCDRTTMTQDDIDTGRLVGLAGVAPIRPAEFVLLRFQMRTAPGDGALL